MLAKPVLLAFAILALCGCGGHGGGGGTAGVAESASRLLAAAVKNDRVAFEAQIDRRAVREDVRRQVAEVARGSALDVDGGPSEFALDRMISPDAIKLVKAGSGEALKAAPTPAQVAPLIRSVDRQHACLAETGVCLLTFAKAHGAWRLVGMKAMGLQIAVAQAGA
ncbi:MAG: hypothetical protein JF588_09445 [Caulobacterales bacterium]|nr:hypothetical protein [Caulobacterales bacterium]